MSETKATAAIVVLMSLWSAVCAASTILMFSSPQEAVIAADSLSNRMEGGQRLMCKIRQVSPHMFFVATGIAATENPHFAPYDIARGGWPTLVRSLLFLFPYQNVGAPSLRFLQGWAAMLLIA